MSWLVALRTEGRLEGAILTGCFLPLGEVGKSDGGEREGGCRAGSSRKKFARVVEALRKTRKCVGGCEALNPLTPFGASASA